MYPAWACLDCSNAEYGIKLDKCPHCNGDRIYEVATFQARGTVTGNVFQFAVHHIFERFFPEFGVIPSRNTDFKDSCDFYVPNYAGIEAKGSPTAILAPDGTKIKFNRPGMRRTDTEKKATTNASTFKNDHVDGNVRFYVLSNALPDAWHEEHSAIDGIYDVATSKAWDDLIFDLDVDKKRAARQRRGRR